MTWGGEWEVDGDPNVSFDVQWNEKNVNGGTFTISPDVYRWDRYTTDNSGSYLADRLSPDPSGAGYWDGIPYGSGSGWRRVDPFNTRTYSKGHTAKTITLTVYTDGEFGTWDGGFYTIGAYSNSWTIQVPARTSYAVTYNANGGSSAPSSQTKWYGESLTLSSTVPTRTYYVFKNWNTKADGSGTSYASGASYTGNANLVLYAQWYAPYAISYNGNGSTSGSVSSQTKVYGKTLTLNNNGYSKTGYTFSKWNTNSSGTGTSYNAGANYTANAAATMFAQWTANTYYVRYNGNGSTSGSMPNSTHRYDTASNLTANAFERTYTVTYNYNGSGAPSTYGTAAYTFSKWNTQAGGGGTNYNDRASVSTMTSTAGATVDLYAQWTSASVTAPSATWTGYNFEGWNTEPDGSGTSYSSGASITPTADMTLYAQWTVAHAAPTISSLLVQRCDSNGTLQDDGTHVLVTASWSIDNSTTGYTDTVASTATITLAGASDTVSLSGTYANDWTRVHHSGDPSEPTTISITQTYPVTLTITDSKGYSTTKSSTVSVAFFTMNFKANGDGIAFGKKSTRAGFDVDMDMYAKNLAVSNNFSAVDGSFSGDIDAVNGSFTGDLGADNATFTGDLGAANATLSGDISADNATLSGEISAAGGTLSNRLNIVDWQFTGVNTGIDRDGAAPASDVYGSGSILFQDKDLERIGFVRPKLHPSGQMDLQMCVLSEDGSGNEIYNSLHISVKKDGTLGYSVSSPSAFREAIDLAPPTKSTSISSIFTGNSSITVTAANYAQWGHVAALFIRFTNNSAISVPASGSVSNITIGTLAAGKRPAVVCAPVSEGDGAGIVHYYIYENGNVAICGIDTRGSAYSIASGTTFYLYGTYLVP